ncbi:MAG: LytR/AlgR family response regulator transcription factor [Cellulosilyticaceae bacterium]
MRIGICDDEYYQRHLLKNIVEKTAKEEKVQVEIEQHTSGEALLGVLEEDMYRYDVLLLDIQMKDLTGMDVARVIRKANTSTLIIFITGVVDYVFEGYSVKAFNYILKPIDEKKVIATLKEAMVTFKVEDKTYYSIVTKEATYHVALEDILYFKSDKRVVEVVTQDGAYTFYSKLDELESTLRDKGFIRCHQRYLVNSQFIAKVSEGIAVLRTNEEVPISRNRYRETMLGFARRALG